MEDIRISDHVVYPVKFNKETWNITDAKHNHVLDIRGWGHLQKLNRAVEIVDSIGVFVQDAINEKLRKQKDEISQANKTL